MALAARTHPAAPCPVSAAAAAEVRLHLAAAVDSLLMLTYNVYRENFLRVHASALMPEIIPIYTHEAVTLKVQAGSPMLRSVNPEKRMMFSEWRMDLDSIYFTANLTDAFSTIST